MERNEATLIRAINTTYFQHLVNDYANWQKAGKSTNSSGSDISDRMLKEFDDGLCYSKGRNYIKIISSRNGGNRTVHSFIVLKPTKGYEIGDILKAASWNAPATNFKRGNVFELASLSGVTWTGAG